LTGVPCPTCGTTRAATAFLEGDLPAGFAANPLAAALGLAFVAGAPLAATWALARWPVPLLTKSNPGWRRIFVLLLVAVNWLYVIVAS
jgi:hypothetical protein